LDLRAEGEAEVGVVLGIDAQEDADGVGAFLVFEQAGGVSGREGSERTIDTPARSLARALR
jgi:hypothetical protein